MRSTRHPQELLARKGRSGPGPVLTAVLAALALAACAGGGAPPAAPAPEQQRVRELDASAERWNRGDLRGFLEPYLDSPETTFVGRSGLLHGRAAIEARYRESYWKDGAPAQTLRFADVRVRALGPDHALATGRYLLSDAAGSLAAQGLFSLVLVRTPAGWRIIHDHSS